MLLRGRAGSRRRRPSTARRWRSPRSWPTTTPPSPIPQRPGDQPQQPRHLLSETGRPAEAEAEYRKATGDPAEAGRRQPRRHRFRSRLAASHTQPRHSCCRRRASRRRRRPSTARPWRSSRSWPTTNPAVTEFRSRLADSHNNLGTCCRRRAGRRRRRPSTARRWRSTGSWPTTTPPSPIPQRPGGQPQQPRQPAVRGRAGRRRRRPSTARRWRSSRSWPTTTPPSPTSAAAWR